MDCGARMCSDAGRGFNHAPTGSGECASESSFATRKGSLSRGTTLEAGRLGGSELSNLMGWYRRQRSPILRDRFARQIPILCLPDLLRYREVLLKIFGIVFQPDLMPLQEPI